MRRSDFRPDIEGMRAIAVLLVVLYHAGFTGLPGGFIGVDVFFVLSGFLITRLLLAEVIREGRVFLPDFWARRARRLFPASTLTLVVVALVSWLVVDPVGQVQTGQDIVAAAAFAANWWFAAQGTDYFAMDVVDSPVLHFWSLSVEEQFYLFWPPILAVLVLRMSRRGWRTPRSFRVAALLLGAVAVLSFLWSLRLTSLSPVGAHFSTFGRAWELAIGGLVAIVLVSGVRLLPHVALIMGYAGLSAVLAGAVLIDDDVPFPGTAALLPVLGTAAMILSGSGFDHRGSVGRLLAWRPLVEIGRLSYSWYLWHWPFIILSAHIFGPLNGVLMTVVVVTSLAAAESSYRYVESPVRHSRWLSRHARNSLMVGAGLIALGVLAGWLLGRSAQTNDSSIRPNPVFAADDLTQAHADGCQSGYDVVANLDCRYAEVGAAEKVVMLGDSHSTQWFPAAEHASLALGREVVVFGKSACVPYGVELWAGKLDRAYTECTAWTQDAMLRIAQLPAGTIVLLAGRNDYLVTDDEGRPMGSKRSSVALREGYVETVRALQRLGMVVVPVRDTPLPPEGSPAVCVADHLEGPSICDFPRPEGSVGPSWEESVLRAAGLGLEVLDLNDSICESDLCPAVVGDVLRWRDADHLSATYVRELGPTYLRALEERLP
ncbi:MAG: acyltransferase family protein [Candidatus Nanopelagicales bacterium]